VARYWLFRIATLVVPHIPLWIAEPLTQLGSLLIWALAGGTRRRVEANLRRVPSLAANPRKLRRAARGVFLHTALNYLDFFRGARMSDDELRDRWVIEGFPLFYQAMAQGRGLVLMTGHYGNWEYGVSRLGLEGYPMVAPAERLRPEKLFELFCRTREHHGLRILPADSRDTLRQLMDALKRNEIAAFLADRHVVGSSVELPFFGEPAKLPAAPMALALRTGAPVLAIFSWRDPGGWKHGQFVPLDLGSVSDEPAPGAAGSSLRGGVAAPARARSGEAVARAMSLYVQAMEERIEAHPEQWVSALATIWD
jgi:KDO2-lipid IV(A) lauroyltransferase